MATSLPSIKKPKYYLLTDTRHLNILLRQGKEGGYVVRGSKIYAFNKQGDLVPIIKHSSKKLGDILVWRVKFSEKDITTHVYDIADLYFTVGYVTNIPHPFTQAKAISETNFTRYRQSIKITDSTLLT